MEVLFVVLPLAIAMAGVALGAFFWAAHRGQFDDLDTPRYRALFDEEPAEIAPAPTDATYPVPRDTRGRTVAPPLDSAKGKRLFGGIPD